MTMTTSKQTSDLEVEFLKKKIAQEKSYVITEMGWEYNDSSYDFGGGTPETIFVDKEKAERYVLEKTTEKVKGMNIVVYDYKGNNNLKYMFKKGKTEKDLMDLGLYLGRWSAEVPKDFTLEDTKKLLEIVDFKLYEIHEVDVIV